jgi:hypothetical protein
MRVTTTFLFAISIVCFGSQYAQADPIFLNCDTELRIKKDTLKVPQIYQGMSDEGYVKEIFPEAFGGTSVLRSTTTLKHFHYQFEINEQVFH